MEVGKVFKECQRKKLYFITETKFESLCERAHEKGLEEITDELVISEIRYQFEQAPYNTRFEPVFEFDAEDKKYYADEYKEAMREYSALKRMYNKYCVGQ